MMITDDLGLFLVLPFFLRIEFDPNTLIYVIRRNYYSRYAYRHTDTGQIDQKNWELRSDFCLQPEIENNKIIYDINTGTCQPQD